MFKYFFPIKLKNLVIRTEADLTETQALKIVEFIRNVLEEIDPFNQNSKLFNILSCPVTPFTYSAELNLFLKTLEEFCELNLEDFAQNSDFINYEEVLKKTFDLFLFDLICKFFKEKISTKNFSSHYSNIYYNSSSILTEVSSDEKKMISGYYFENTVYIEDDRNNKFFLSSVKNQDKRTFRCIVKLYHPVEYYKVKKELEEVNDLALLEKNQRIIFTEEVIKNF